MAEACAAATDLLVCDASTTFACVCDVAQVLEIVPLAHNM